MNNESSFNSADLLVGAMLLTMGLLVRVLMLGRTGIWLDEAFSLFYARQPVGWLIEHAAGLINHPPGYFLILKLWETALGSSQTILEGLSVLFSLIAILLFYRWVRLDQSRWRSVLVAGLFAVHPFVLYYSLELRMYPLALAGITGFGLSLRLLLEESHWTRWTGLGFAALFCLYTHSLTFLYLLPGFCVLGWTMQSRGRVRQYWTTVGIVGLLYLPWAYYVVRQATRISSDFWIPPFGPGEVVRLVYAWGGYVQPHDFGFAHVVGATAVTSLFVVPLLYAVKSSRSVVDLWYWLTVLIPFVLVTGVSLTGQSVFLLRGFLFGFPFVFLLWGRGLLEVPPGIGRTVTGLFLVFLVFNCYRLAKNPPHRFVKDIAATVKASYPEETTTVHTSKRTFMPLQMYYRPDGTNRMLGDHLRYFFPSNWETTLSQLRRSSRNRPVLFVIYENEYPQWKQLIENIENASLERTRTIVRGRKVFHLVFLSEGFGRPGVSLARSHP